MNPWNDPQPVSILTWPHQSLQNVIFARTDPVPLDWVERLLCTMYRYHGLGLAANQIGCNHRIFVMRVPNGIERVFINPKITASSDELVTETEGCLSLPGLFVPVMRHLTIDVSGQDGDKLYTIGLEGLEARVAQHEIDHLNGIVLNRDESVRLL